jgi:hypothetical protein
LRGFARRFVNESFVVRVEVSNIHGLKQLK